MTIPPAPARRPKKPWYARWWAIVLYAVVGVCMIGTIAGVLGADEPGDVIEDAVNDTVSDTGAVGDTTFSNVDHFEPVAHSGSGADVIALPEGATQGFITATHNGSSNFIVTALDHNNEPTADLLVNTIGSYNGSAAFGLLGFGGDATNLEVMADGDWEITISHLNDAPTLALPADGEGDAVFQYAGGDPATWQLTHTGSSNFIVGSTSALMGMVNEIGSYDGTVPVTADPAIITIMADGAWTISAS